jgi:hypothetical protein
VEKQRAVILYHARPGTMRSWNRRAFEVFSTLTSLDSRFKSPRAHASTPPSIANISRIHFEGLFCRLLAGDPTSGFRLGASSLVGVNAERNDSNPRNQSPITENNLKEVKHESIRCDGYRCDLLFWKSRRSVAYE